MPQNLIDKNKSWQMNSFSDENMGNINTKTIKAATKTS